MSTRSSAARRRPPRFALMLAGPRRSEAGSGEAAAGTCLGDAPDRSRSLRRSHRYRPAPPGGVHPAPILNVSVFGNFVFSDTPDNGIGVVVDRAARLERAPQDALAMEIAERAWATGTRFKKALTSLDRRRSGWRRHRSERKTPYLFRCR